MEHMAPHTIGQAGSGLGCFLLATSQWQLPLLLTSAALPSGLLQLSPGGLQAAACYALATVTGTPAFVVCQPDALCL